MVQGVTLEMVYNKLSRLESKVSSLEKRLVPEAKVSEKETAELEKIRQEIRQGETISEKELFSLLSK
jgi:hypothetical protein